MADTAEEVIEEEVIAEDKPDDVPAVVDSGDTVEGDSPKTDASEPLEEEHRPSRRESLRIQKLLADNAELRRQLPPNLKKLDYSKALDADEETLKRLEEDRHSYAEQAFTSGQEQAKSVLFHTRLEVDAPRVEAKYPQLDKDSADFNPAVADAINSMYLSSVGYDPKTDTVTNPNMRYRDYVESFMELVDATAGQKVARTQSNIVRQVAQTALRPTGGTAKKLNLNQAPESMTTEELQAVIESTIPSVKAPKRR